MTRAYPLRFEIAFVERAVREAIESQAPSLREAFHREREPIYAERDPDRREAEFRSLNGRWFRRLALASPFHQAVAERSALHRGTGRAHVCAASVRRDEHADLLVLDGARGRAGRTLVLRVRPVRLGDGSSLLAFLRRELLHVADMLDPEFGYRPAPLRDNRAPSLENLLRDRYRVLWRTTVEGRLHREGLLDAEVRETSRAAFARTFAMLGAAGDLAHARWFDGPRPQHAALVAFARDPLGVTGGRHRGWSGWCPLCGMPSGANAVEELSSDTVKLLRTAHPTWEPSRGLCAQCALLGLAVRAPEGGRRTPDEAAGPGR